MILERHVGIVMVLVFVKTKPTKSAKKFTRIARKASAFRPGIDSAANAVRLLFAILPKSAIAITPPTVVRSLAILRYAVLLKR